MFMLVNVDFSHFKIACLSLHSVLVSPEAITEQGLDVCCRVQEAVRKFPLQIQDVIDDTGKTAEVNALEFIKARSTGSHQVSALVTCSLAYFLQPTLPLLCIYCS